MREYFLEGREQQKFIEIRETIFSIVKNLKSAIRVKTSLKILGVAE